MEAIRRLEVVTPLVLNLCFKEVSGGQPHALTALMPEK
jgi:hypothetical protein